MLSDSDIKQSMSEIALRVSHHRHFPFYLIVFLALVVSGITMMLASDRTLTLHGAEKVFQSRDFSKTPFGLMDAYDACLAESQAKFGDSLLRSQMLPLSTRFDESSQEYLVVINADVGVIDDWTQATIYCSIDPVAEQISYYKEVHDGQESILSKTMSFLSAALR